MGLEAEFFSCVQPRLVIEQQSTVVTFETCVYCLVHIFDRVIFYYFRCDVYFLLSDKTTFNKGCLLNNLFCHIYAQAQGATPSHTKPHPKNF